MVELPTLPRRIAALPKDRRGYPVPAFVVWMKDGEPVPHTTEGAEPDFRVISPGYLTFAYKNDRCWICREPLGTQRVLVLGPMCLVNRVNSEPASHRGCAEFAVRACPFLVHPRMKRLPTDDIPDIRSAGIMIDRNPGCMALVEVRRGTYPPFQAGDGVLFELNKIDRIDWWREGRRATREEIMDSIDSGLPLLRKQCFCPDDHKALDAQIIAAFTLLPAA